MRTPRFRRGARCARAPTDSRTALRGRLARIASMKPSSLASDISNAGSSSVRSSRSRSARTRSCAPSSIGEPQTTISGSPMSTPHQRVARHFAATSWLTRSGPMKKTSGSPLKSRPCCSASAAALYRISADRCWSGSGPWSGTGVSPGPGARRTAPGRARAAPGDPGNKGLPRSRDSAACAASRAEGRRVAPPATIASARVRGGRRR